MRKIQITGRSLLKRASKTAVVTGLLVSAIGTASAYEPMPVFPKVDLDDATVGGISAGAYFAAQFHVAWSSKLNGVGVIAGGPWGCADGNLATALGRCMEGPVTESDIDELVTRANQKASTGAIDAIDNMADDKIFLISGTKDITTRPSVMNSVQPFYEELGVPTQNIMYVNDMELGHAMPTLDYGNECKVDTEPPWISNCNYDAAGEMLKHFYATEEEPLNPRVDTDNLTGDFIEYDQAEFTGSVSPAAISLNEKGVLYVPKACQEDGEAETCRLHVFFHGCEQVYDSIPKDRSGDNWLYDHPPYEIFGDKLWKNAGLNEWADSNNIVIMYPQWKKSDAAILYNPKGCNDWWGYTTTNYDEKNGPQMLAIQNMMEKISADKLGDTAEQIAAREAAEAAQLAAQSEALIITLTEEISELADEASLTNNIDDFRTPYGSAKDKLTEAESYFANLQTSAQTAREKADHAEEIASGSEAAAEAESSAQAAEQSEANAETALANAKTSLKDGLMSLIGEISDQIDEIRSETEDLITEAEAAKSDALSADNSADAETAFINAETIYNEILNLKSEAESLNNEFAAYASEAVDQSDTDLLALSNTVSSTMDSISNAVSTVKGSRDAAQEAFTSNLSSEAQDLINRSQNALEQAQEAAQNAENAKQKAEDALAAITNTTDSQAAVDSQKEASLAAQEAADYASQAQSAADLAQSIAEEAVGTEAEGATSTAVDNANSYAHQASESSFEAEKVFSDAKDAAIAVAEAAIQSALDAIEQAEAERSISMDYESFEIAEEHLAAAQAQLEAAQQNLALANAIDMTYEDGVEPAVTPVEIIPEKKKGGGGGSTNTTLLLCLLSLGLFSRRKSK